ncbi:MAG: hypothetical protein JNK77_17085 [Saprospiraceae bacterium]|nr:hypothetical protein [Saprospiraceae bacterium]
MNTPQSNAKQRRHALLRAIALVVIVMLFTGFGVSLAPLAKYQEQFGSDQDCRRNTQELALLKQQREALLALLKKMEVTYAAISELDGQYESSNTSNASAKLMRRMEPLEVELGTRVTELPDDTLATHAAKAYDYLLIARKMIWKLRLNNWPDDPDGGGAADCKEELIDMRREARDIASALDLEARTLEDARIKGLFGNKKETRRKLDNVVGQLRSLANRLRAI